ncbi:MAG: hypothetical protein ABWW65_00150 [Thermoprotei archaeon]
MRIITRSRALLFALLFSFLFLLSFIYIAYIVPPKIHRVLEKYFPDYSVDVASRYVKQVIDTLYLPITILFIAIIAIAITGLLLRVTKLSLASILTIYLPVFGYFTIAMNFFAGIGILRVLLIPFIASPEPLSRLGDFLAYVIMLFLLLPALPVLFIAPTHTNVAIQSEVFFLQFLGIAILFLGTLTWFYGKLRGYRVIDFWIYKYSRHPQYLGLIIWSIGYMYSLPSTAVFGTLIFPYPSTLLLLYILLITGTALVEEINLLGKYPEYEVYWSKTPFLLPLPKPVTSILCYPVRKILGKPYPENPLEVLLVIIVYFAIISALSLMMYPLAH